MIQIENLTQRQRIICDVLWGIDTKEGVLAFIKSLPVPTQMEAVTLYHLMCIETLDENMGDDFSLANKVIDSIK